MQFDPDEMNAGKREIPINEETIQMINVVMSVEGIVMVQKLANTVCDVCEFK